MWYRRSKRQQYKLLRRNSTNRPFDSPTTSYPDHIFSILPIRQSTTIVIQVCKCFDSSFVFLSNTILYDQFYIYVQLYYWML